MNKLFKGLLTIGLAGNLLAGVVAHAQEGKVSDERAAEIIKTIDEKSKESVEQGKYYQAKFNTEVATNVDSLVGKEIGEQTLKLDGDIALNLSDLDRAFDALALNLNVDLQGAKDLVESVKNGVEEALVQVVKVIVKENVLYVNDGSGWKAQDISKEIKEAEDQVKESEKESKDLKVKLDQGVEFQQKLYTQYGSITEGDGVIKVTLPEGYDKEGVFKLFDETVNLKELLANINDETLSQLEKQGTISKESLEETRTKLKEYEGLQYDLVKYFLSTIESVETVYDQETYQLKSTKVSLSVKKEELLNNISDETIKLVASMFAPEYINVKVGAEMEEKDAANEIEAPTDYELVDDIAEIEDEDTDKLDELQDQQQDDQQDEEE